MKKIMILFFFFLVTFSFSNEILNEDVPQKGEWDFNLKKIWEVDGIEKKDFQNPSELRALEDGTLYFHDFAVGESYIFDKNGRYTKTFAPQGKNPGEVSRYINCFVSDDQVIIGTPDKLHVFSKEGKYLSSYPNNLFERFPILVLKKNEIFFAVGRLTDTRLGKPGIIKFDLESKEEKLIKEFSVPAMKKSGPPGMSIIVLGLTPQVKMAYDSRSNRIYYGRTDEYRIYAADPSGDNIRTFLLKRQKNTVSLDEKRKHFEGTRIPKDQLEKIIPSLPDEMTYFQRIRINNGLVYVFPTKSILRRQSFLPVDIFSLEGKYLYRSRIRFSDDESLFSHIEKIALRKDRLYAILETRDGKKKLAGYKISVPASPI
jgi:hypothetical protein